MSDDATLVRAFSALLFRVRHPAPRYACAYKSDCGSSFPVTKKNSPRTLEVMHVNYIYGCSAELRLIVLDQEAYDISATVDDYFLKRATRHIAAKLSVRAAIHRDDRPGSGHLFY
jgi:hypothetical protein